MAGKNRKAAQHLGEDTDERSESVDMQAIVKLMMEGYEKAEARRVADALEAEARRVADALEADRREEARSEKAAADKLAEEDRAEARRIAAEDRAEARRRADKIAEEERAEIRTEAKREKKLERERRAEAQRAAQAQEAMEMMAVREETARLATEKMMEARDAKQYAQQVALLKMQADISEAAGTAQREELAKNKRRDRALDSILNFREGEDIEEFLLTAEVPEREWVTAVSSKLNGEMGSSWQKLSVTVDATKQ